LVFSNGVTRAWKEPLSVDNANVFVTRLDQLLSLVGLNQVDITQV